MDVEALLVVAFGPGHDVGGTLTALVSLADDGKPLASPELSKIARRILALEQAPALHGLRDAHRAKLAVHHARHGLG